MDLPEPHDADVSGCEEGTGDERHRGNSLGSGHCLPQMGSAGEFMKRDGGPGEMRCDISDSPTSSHEPFQVQGNVDHVLRGKTQRSCT